MSKGEKHVEVIDLCSDDDGDNDEAAHRPRALSNDGVDEKVSHKRRRTSSTQQCVVVLLKDENLETTDVSDLLARLPANNVNYITLFSHIDNGINPPSLYQIQQRDQWSCGFRNLQMIMANLLASAPVNHGYFQDRPKQDGQVVEILSLLEIQHLLEQAWASGWDANGAKHYHGKLAHKKVWIGAVEVASALGFLDVDCTILQFMECPQSRALLGPFCQAYFDKSAGCCACLVRSSRDCATETLQWVEQHQRIRQPATIEARPCACPVLPLYLQWEGHSVTIVGVELNKDKIASHLLVLDPMKSGQHIAKELRQGRIAPLRKPLVSLSSRNAQIILSSTNILSNGQRETMKRTANCLTAAEKDVEKALRSNRGLL